MTITTKYYIEQRVWIMHDNEPQEWIIKAIHLGTIKDKTGNIPLYDLHTTESQPLGGVCSLQNVWEYKIHATKRELCLSYLTDKD